MEASAEVLVWGGKENVSTRLSRPSHSEAQTGWSISADITAPAHSAVVP